MASNAKALSFLSGDLSLSGTEVSINVAGSVQSDSITGSTITMKNTGSTIVASDGTTAVLSESGGTVTLTADEANVGSNALVVNSSGNVGIGTSSPIRKLTVSQAGTAEFVLQDTTRTVDGRNFRIFYDNGGLVFGTLNDAGTAGTDRMRIDSSGNVGIGTSPSTKLDISDTSRLTVNVSNAYVLETSLNSTGSAFASHYENASDHIFQTSGTERMRIDPSGNLLFNSGYGSVATVYGCRAWVNFNGTGTVAIRDSGNVSSITDNGTGDYSVNFATAMPDANYAYAFGRVAPDTSGNNLAIALKGTNSGAATGAKTTSSFRLLNGIAYPNSYVDSAEISVLFFR